MKNEHLIFTKAVELPEAWDAIVEDNIFLNRSMLAFLERVNPCRQEYHMFTQGEPDSVVVTYKLGLDIFTYSKFSLKLPITIIGIPCSVSQCGYKIGKRTAEDVYAYLQSIKGARLILNSDSIIKINNFACGETLPTCKLNLKWKTFEQYLGDMRSHYRYRMYKAINKWSDVEITELTANTEFDEELYALYLQVYNKSNYKLEKLPIEFFREAPTRIIKFSFEHKAIAFIQLLENGEQLQFLFGGFDYKLNLKMDIYINILLEIVRRGIVGGFSNIDMGQTAEETKLKLGCYIQDKKLYASHSNKIINFLVIKGIGILSYRKKELDFHVFRGGIL